MAGNRQVQPPGSTDGPTDAPTDRWPTDNFDRGSQSEEPIDRPGREPAPTAPEVRDPRHCI
jgi:hypothetical protein